MTRRLRRVCVFSGSSAGRDPAYATAALALGLTEGVAVLAAP